MQTRSASHAHDRVRWPPRLSTAVSSVLIGWLLAQVGSHGVLAFIVISMSIVASVIALLGPRTRNRALEEIAG